MAVRNAFGELAERVQEVVYPLEAPQRCRTVPMQVLAVGPARSGTDSLREALMQLGYDHVYHGYDIALNAGDDKAWRRLFRQKWLGIHKKHQTDGREARTDLKETHGCTSITAEDFDTVIGHCAAITDFGAACFARELIMVYPSAKVILNTRSNVEEWHQSCSNTIVQLKGDWRLWIRSFFSAELFWAQKSFLRGLWPAFYRGEFAATGRWVLEEHRALVRGSVRKENLLEWSPEDGWEPLCHFLDKPIPSNPFPRGNGSQAYVERIGILYQGYVRKADNRLLALALLMSISILGAVWLHQL